MIDTGAEAMKNKAVSSRGGSVIGTIIVLSLLSPFIAVLAGASWRLFRLVAGV